MSSIVRISKKLFKCDKCFKFLSMILKEDTEAIL